MITVPYNWEPNKYQLEVLQSPAIFKVIKWHRRAMKTTLAINELMRWCYGQRGIYAYVAPFRDQAKKIVWDNPNMLQKYCPPADWKNRNNSELKITFLNGSILYILGADNPDNLRGLDLRGIVFDEWDDMKEQIWDIVKPIFSANGGWAWFLGTPKGTGNLKRKIAQAQDSDRWATFVLKASKSGIIPQEELEEDRRMMPAAMFAQEYEVEDVESASSVFRRIKENTYTIDDSYDPLHRYQLGIDLGKHQDWTVITPFDLNTFRVQKQIRFNQVDWPLQKSRIETEYLRWGTANGRPLAIIDATGVGDPIADDLEQAGVRRLERFVFTERSREELLRHLAVLLEQDRIKIPDDEGLRTELESFHYALTANGRKVRMEVAEGLHDDRVMSLALAVWQAKEKLPLELNHYEDQPTFDPYSPI